MKLVLFCISEEEKKKKKKVVLHVHLRIVASVRFFFFAIMGDRIVDEKIVEIFPHFSNWFYIPVCCHRGALYRFYYGINITF